MREVDLKIQLLDPGSLVPYVNNAKEHPDEQIDELVRQIHGHGWDVPIVVDENLVIIKGHGRREAALRMNLPRVPVIMRSDLTAEEKIAIRIGDNKISDMGGWDKDKLSFDLGTLRRAEFDLALTSVQPFELDALMPDDDPMRLPDASKGDGGGGSTSEKSFTIQYTIVFNTLEEQQKWFEFLGVLRRERGHIETVAGRILDFVDEKLPPGTVPRG